MQGLQLKLNALLHGPHRWAKHSVTLFWIRVIRIWIRIVALGVLKLNGGPIPVLLYPLFDQGILCVRSKKVYGNLSLFVEFVDAFKFGALMGTLSHIDY